MVFNRLSLPSGEFLIIESPREEAANGSVRGWRPSVISIVFLQKAGAVSMDKVVASGIVDAELATVFPRAEIIGHSRTVKVAVW